MTKGAVEVFAKDKPMSTLARFAKEALTAYADPTVIGAVLDNHDLPRFNSLASDKSNVYNAMALQFLFGGIPTMYYGLEQNMTGEEDPQNRQALWLNGELKTDGESYQRIKRLNLVRKKMGELGGFHEVLASQVAVQDDDIAFERNGGLLVLTKVSEGPRQIKTALISSAVKARVASGQSARLASPPAPRSSSRLHLSHHQPSGATLTISAFSLARPLRLERTDHSRSPSRMASLL